MALQIVPSTKARPVKRSLVLAFAGIPQRRPLSPNGRVFRRLAGPIANFTLDADGHLGEILTWEEAFVIRFTRWLGEPLAKEWVALFAPGQSVADVRGKMGEFMSKLAAHREANPPPWESEAADDNKTLIVCQH